MHDMFVLLWILLGSVGVAFCIAVTGWFATVRPRSDYKIELIKTQEQSKLNAVTLQEKNLALDMKREQWHDQAMKQIADRSTYPSLKSIEDDLG